MIKTGYPHSLFNVETIHPFIEMDREFFEWPWSEKQWLDTLRDDSNYFVGACWEEEELIGFALFGLSKIESLAHLYKILILEEFRGTQKAKKLLSAALVDIKQKGIDRVYLEVSVNNQQAPNFYKKSQFETLVKKRNFYSDGSSAFAMQKYLPENLSN